MRWYAEENQALAGKVVSSFRCSGKVACRAVSLCEG